VEPRPEDGPTDGELLDCFRKGHDPMAFAALLRKHGPMVLGVCRRVLKDPHDAEDAFQATFLVFLRKAGSIGNREAVGSWLYQVPYHAALRIRAATARKPEPLSEAQDMSAVEPSDAAERRELQPLLDELVNALPQKYRRPIVLCYVQGLTAEQAAQELGCPVGTGWAWLARGR